MKRLPFVALIGLFTACGTTTTGPNPFVAAAAGIAGAAAQWAVNTYPDKRPQFQAAAEALTVWLDTGRATGVPLDIAKLNSILGNLQLGQDGWGANGELYLQAGLIVWNLALGVNYKVTSQPAIQEVGGAIRDGFMRGLAAPTTPVSKAIAAAATIPPPVKRVRLGKILEI